MTRLRSEKAVLAGYAALTLYFVWPVLTTGSALGISDWDAHLFQYTSVFRSVYEYGQLPFWNPWFCGGNVLWQNPQAPLITPLYALALLVSVPAALKINIALHYLIGLLGMHVLLRKSFAITARAWLVSLGAVFTFAGGPTFHLSVGHATFLPYFYLPWLLWAFIAALERGSSRHALGAGAMLALSVFAGGIHVAAMSAVALTILAVTAAIHRRDWRPLAIVAVTGVFAGMLAAPKVLPVLLFSGDPGLVDIRYFPPGPDRMSIRILETSLLDPFQYRRLAIGGMLYGWHEYGNYIGGFSVFLALAALVRVFTKPGSGQENWLGVALAVTTVTLLLISLGDLGRISPYRVLHALPGLTDLRVPSRYLLVTTLFATATLAWVVTKGGGPGTGPLEGISTLISMALLLSTLFVVQRNRDLLYGTFPYAPLQQSLEFLSRPRAPVIDTATDGFGPDSPMLRAAMAGRAVLRCNEPLHLAGQVDPSRAPVFSAEAAVSRIVFSPNQITFRAVVPARPARVFLNQRYVRGWRSSAGTIEIDPATRLPYVSLPAGAAGSYSFSFFPPGLITGLVLFGSALVMAVLFSRRTTWMSGTTDAQATGSHGDRPPG